MANMKNKELLVSEIKRVSSIVADQTSDIIINARWFSTVVLAEIAGLVSFALKLDGELAGRLFIIILILFGVSTGSFFYTIHKSMDIKYDSEKNFSKFMTKIIFENLDYSEKQTEALITEIQEQFKASSKSSSQRVATDLGLLLFFIGSVLSVFLLLKI